MSGVSGTNTPRYRVVQGHFYPLVVHFEQDLSTLAAKFFEKKLISVKHLEEASNSNQPSFEKSSALLRRILKKIEINQNSYDVFVSVLRGIGELKDIAREIKAALKLEEDSTNASASPMMLTAPLYPKKQVKEHVRSYSDSEVIQSKSHHAAEVDSGVQQLSTLVDSEEVFPEEVDDCAPAFEPVHGDESGAANGAAQLVLPKLATSICRASNGSASAHTKDEDAAMEGTPPVQRVSSDGSVVPTTTANSFVFSDAWHHGVENKYLKSQTAAQDSEISGLRQTIENLEEEKANSVEKLKQQGIVISKKDEIIANLEQDCKEKDELVEDLKKNKAEMEKKIGTLCAEAEAESQEKIKHIHRSYKEQLDELQKRVDEAESRENIAEKELAIAKAKLSDALLEKEREISKLREEFFKLQLSKKNLEEEKRYESALKEKELALKDKEIALQAKELLMKDKEVAEVKEKRAEDAACYAKKETEHAKKETEHANKERRKSELRVLELERELEKLQLVAQK